MRKRFTALLSVAALTTAVAAFTAAPAGAQEDPVAEVGIFCVQGEPGADSDVYVAIQADEDIDIWDAEIGNVDEDVWALLEFYLEDEFGDPLADPLGVLEAGDVGVAEVPEDVVEAGAPYEIWVEYENLDTEDLEELFTTVYIDTCGASIEIVGECTEDGLEATIEVTFANDTLVDLEYLEGWVYVPPEYEGTELTLDPTTIPNGETAVSEPFLIPGDTVGVVDVELYFLAEGAIEENEVVFDIEFFTFASWEVDGCEVVPIPFDPEPEAAPAVAAEPAFTG